MNPRERWQTLQSHLSAARGALAAGDRAVALEHIESALAIDPEFLAARMLRDQVASPPAEKAITSSVSEPMSVADAPAAAWPAAAVSGPTAVSAEALTSFEERVKQRVRNREVAIARAQRTRRRLAIPVAAAAGVWAAMSSTMLYEPNVLHSRSLVMAAPLVELNAPEPLVISPAPDGDGATPVDHALIRPAPAPTPIAMTAIVDAPPEPVHLPPPQPPLTQTAPVAQPVQPQPPRGVQVLPPRPMPDAVAAAAITPPAVVPAVLVSTVDDRALVDQALQQYRRAYNRLDARSAQMVYPGVNEGALARAFDGLESQVLLFDSCEIDLQGRSANVTCRGSSHYVPKVGNHETRVEPRIWNFTLRKDDDGWKIENARAAR